MHAEQGVSDVVGAVPDGGGAGGRGLPGQLAATGGAAGAGGGGYTLGFVEFDEQGLPFDPAQQTRLFDELYRQTSLHRDVVIVTFVHGWHHSAEDSDGNVGDFRTLLGTLAKAERLRPPGKQRVVFGLYVGWRGENVSVP